MFVAHLVDLKQTRTGVVHGRKVGGKRDDFIVPLFDAINRLDKQPTTLNFIFSFFETFPTIKRSKFNKKNLSENFKKGKEYPWVFYIFSVEFFFGGIFKFRRLYLIEEHQKRLEPIFVAQLFDFEQTRTGVIPSREVGGKGGNFLFHFLTRSID